MKIFFLYIIAVITWFNSVIYLIKSFTENSSGDLAMFIISWFMTVMFAAIISEESK